MISIYIAEDTVKELPGTFEGMLRCVEHSFALFSIVNGSTFALSPFAVLVVFLFSAVVGIVFGFYLARHAARLDPIVALSTE